MTDKTPSVLLVDDDPYTRQIFQLIMDHLKYSNYSTIDNATLAIDYLQVHDTQFVIVDLFMPTIDGFKLLDMIREIDSNQNCRVVATTSYYNNSTEEKVKRRGFDAYLPKPLKLENIVSLMESLSE